MKGPTLFRFMCLIAFAFSTTSFAETKAYTSTGAVAPTANTETGTVTTPAPPKTATPQLNVDDADITASVQGKLAKDPMLAGSNITVITNGGVVTLDGTVNSQGQADEAVKIAKAENGIKNVQSKLTINNTSTNPNAATTR